ncbi:uncharacterized protein LOC125178949 [Hyalella azteca]|uniref:Uncharacterized protein LOC125178949 n=1 Tax=Hyalella azteca TaxID=294128 RepID=A0A979FUR8_HYAAZ|nr:uncharacterized protein LOC125178949 [Hyalella azteca]
MWGVLQGSTLCAEDEIASLRGHAQLALASVSQLSISVLEDTLAPSAFLDASQNSDGPEVVPEEMTVDHGSTGAKLEGIREQLLALQDALPAASCPDAGAAEGRRGEGREECSFVPVPGHCGIAGNVAADALARAALNLANTTNLTLGTRNWKVKIAKHYRSVWHTAWSTLPAHIT